MGLKMASFDDKKKAGVGYEIYILRVLPLPTL